MKKLALVIACASAATAFGAPGGPNPFGRPTGLPNAITHMSPQGLAHQQGTANANPFTRTLPPGTILVTPATPAVAATPAVPGSNGAPATPAVPAQPAVPAMPAKPGTSGQ